MIPDNYQPAQQVQLEEPAAFHGRDKKQIHTEFSGRLFMIHYACKANTRQYLVQVALEQVYLVERQEMEHFWADLSDDERGVTPYFSAAVAFRRLQEMLANQNQLPLGMTADKLPDEEWIIKMLRFVDRKNITATFKRRVQGTAPLTGDEGHISYATAHGQSLARMDLGAFNGHNVFVTNKKLNELIMVVWETYRKWLAKRVVNQVVLSQSPAILGAIAQLELDLNTALDNASTALYNARDAVANPDIDPRLNQQAALRIATYNRV